MNRDNSPRIMYPVAFILVLFILMPYTSIFVHLATIGTGVFYVNGIFTQLLIPPSALSMLESLPFLSKLTRFSNFIPASGSIQLNDKYVFYPLNSSESRMGLNRYSQSPYNPIQEDEALLKSEGDSLWNDVHQNEKQSVEPSERV